MRLTEQYAKNVEAIIAEVRMSRGRFFVLVEGSSDYRFLSRHVRDGVCVKSVRGRDAVVNATRILEGVRSQNFVGLVDADLKAVVTRAEQMPRLVHVSLAEGESESCIDLEACLIRTKALEKVCVEAFGDQVESEGGADAVANRIRSWLRQTAAAIGAYRAAVMEHCGVGDRVASLGDFDDCWERDWRRFAKADTLSCDRRALEAVMREYVNPKDKFATIRQTAADYTAKCGNGWLLCRGHDMTRLLAMRFSMKEAEIRGTAEVERSLRMSFDRQMLEQTAFGRKLLAYGT